MPNISSFASREEYNDYYRKYREKNREKLRAYNRKYNMIFRKKNGYKNERASQKRYPEKQLARYLLNYAIKKGFLKRGTSCEECGTTKKIQAHHPNYYEPLKVKWLCPLCHTKEHRKVIHNKLLTNKTKGV